MALIIPRSDVLGQAATDSVRVHVRLHHERSVESLQLTLDEGRLGVLLPSGGAPVLRLQPDETVTLGRRQNEIYLRKGDGGLYADSVFLAPLQEATWTIDVNAESTRTYTGGLALSLGDASDDVQLVNRVPLHDYVSSVVAGEYGLSDREGAKAMAVVARTYALFSDKYYNGEYDHVDGTASQVYRGTDIITEEARRVARQTRGEILTYEGKPIQAVYYSSSGGHTANNEAVWTDSDPLPYLRGKKDPYDEASPHHRWSARIDRTRLLQALTVSQNASVNGFLLGDRTPSGRLATIELIKPDGPNDEIEADTFRSVVNENLNRDPLKSTWFDARREGSRYVFEGRGYGHGVGLNQWGAHAMAKKGKTHRDILSFYFSGTQVRQLDELQAPLTRPAIAEETPTQVPDSSKADSTSRRVGW